MIEKGPGLPITVLFIGTTALLANACPVRVTEKEKMNVFVPFPVTPI